MGDFKLKTDPEYIVPEEQRQNAVKKRRQMVLLEESVHSIRMEFNQRFLALSEVKRQMMKDIGRSNSRILEINGELSLSEPVFEPTLASDENPEARNQVTDDELAVFQVRAAAANSRTAMWKLQIGRVGFGTGVTENAPWTVDNTHAFAAHV
jgi:hypothetical protein